MLGHKLLYNDLPLHIEETCVRCGYHVLMCYEVIDDRTDNSNATIYKEDKKMTEEEKNDDYRIEEDHEQNTLPKIAAAEPEGSINDWLVGFGADLANNILEKMQDKHEGDGSRAHKNTDATECIMFAQQLDNSLYAGDVLSGIVILDAGWLDGLRRFLGEIKVPDSFDQEQMRELMVSLRCLEYHGLALMQADVRDQIVDSLMSLSDEIELAAYRAQSR